MVGVAVTIVGILWHYPGFASRTREIFTEITIRAPFPDVWEVLTKLEGYQYWNPLIVAAGVDVGVRQRLECHPQLNGMNRPLRFHPRITHLESQVCFAWRGQIVTSLIGVGEHLFELSSGGGKTRLKHRQVISGLLIPLVWQSHGGKESQWV